MFGLQWLLFEGWRLVVLFDGVCELCLLLFLRGWCNIMNFGLVRCGEICGFVLVVGLTF